MRPATVLFHVVALATMGLSPAIEIGDIKCTKFLYEEQLLEKMVRLEFFVETMEKEMKRMVEEVQSKLAEIEDAAAKGAFENITTTATTTIEHVPLDSAALNDIEMNMKHLIESGFAEVRNETLPKLNKKIGDLTRLEAKLRTPNVAFAAINVVKSPKTKRDPVVFTSILLNDGAGYSAKTGSFKAPVSGVYQFNAQLCASSESDLEYGIKVGSRRIVAGEFRIPVNSKDGKCTSFGALAYVQQRQEVTVQGWGVSLFNNDNDWNTFSGALLYTRD